MSLLTDLNKINHIAVEKESENDSFRVFLKQQDISQVDNMVHQLNEEIAPQIDCTKCGNCCKSLMINITEEEAISLATRLQVSVADAKKKYIEQSEQGKMIINTIPCHFLEGSSCSIYEHRFTECREFPHLHKPHFPQRLFGTLMYYAMCPIIFNVVERLKEAIGFSDLQPAESGN
ncbi:MAG: YkgJ family cysteine cluster protein [Ferruginibacter sp.]